MYYTFQIYVQFLLFEKLHVSKIWEQHFCHHTVPYLITTECAVNVTSTKIATKIHFGNMTGDGNGKQQWQKQMPLTTKRKTWDVDAKTTQLKLNAKSGTSVQFMDSFYILYGNEEPKLYLQFCMIYFERI